VKIPSNIITLILGIVLTLISLWYGQNHGLMPVAASEDAKQIDSVFNLMMTIATGLFLLVEGILVYCLIKFRRRPGDQTDGPPIEGNVPLEIVWTAIPTVIVFVLSIYSFEVYNNIGGLDPVSSADVPPQVAMQGAHAHGQMVAMDASHARVALGIGPSGEQNQQLPPLEVDVRGIQYAWIFTYPETGIVTGELHIPVNRTVKLNMIAGDVIHAFWVPQLRLKQDVIPGRPTVLAFNPNQVGDYPIICAELCGAYHGGMKTVLHVESQSDYDQWVQQNTVALKESPQDTAAINTANLSDGEFLSPYARQMGIESETLAQIHPFHHHHGM
jgi:cytochrome c oxidase subunit 2